MKQNFVFASLFILSFVYAEKNQASPEPFTQDVDLSGYHFIWGDEFKGSVLTTNQWVYRNDSTMWSTQKPENVEVSDGTLKIFGRKESAEGKDYTGGGVISRRTFRYGYYESRLKVPRGAGWHTSFWMMRRTTKADTSPASQELDVIENDSVNPHKYGVNIHKWMGEHIAFGGKTVKTPDLSEDFHVFGCLFTPTNVTYLFDGKIVQTVDVTHATRKNGSSADFAHGDQNIWLTSIASPLGGTQAVDDAKLPAVAEYDYVRFFEKK